MARGIATMAVVDPRAADAGIVTGPATGDGVDPSIAPGPGDAPGPVGTDGMTGTVAVPVARGASGLPLPTRSGSGAEEPGGSDLADGAAGRADADGAAGRADADGAAGRADADGAAGRVDADGAAGRVGAAAADDSDVADGAVADGSDAAGPATPAAGTPATPYPNDTRATPPEDATATPPVGIPVVSGAVAGGPAGGGPVPRVEPHTAPTPLPVPAAPSAASPVPTTTVVGVVAPAVAAAPVRAAPVPGAVDVAEAEEFLRLFHHEDDGAGDPADRIAAVRDEIARTGTYVHTPAELAFGARVAWRNSARCIGRLYWRSLHVRDRRHVTAPADVADECVGHLREATRRGRIRSTITVFAPDTPTTTGPRVWNEQLIRYAGYRTGGRVLGDPRLVGFTDTARSLGWVPPSPMGRFDVLPLVVSGGGEHAAEGPQWFDVPSDAVLEVPLTHPDHAWFADLGLRWHALPVISNMKLDIGGVSYPAAPFNGWYMATEIGARNLADADRYDLLPDIAAKMGLDTSSERTMWRDRAVVELTLAVQSSFDAAGVSVADHHGESQRFLRHVEREETAGRHCPVDWSWIVPPISGGLTPVFHRYYDEPTDTGPMFRMDPTAKARGQGCPV